MKLFSLGAKKQFKNFRNKKMLNDYYQESVNSYGKKQLKSLTDRGLSVQW
jgi:hypothetical protein